MTQTVDLYKLAITIDPVTAVGQLSVKVCASVGCEEAALRFGVAQ